MFPAALRQMQLETVVMRIDNRLARPYLDIDSAYQPEQQSKVGRVGTPEAEGIARLANRHVAPATGPEARLR